MKPMEIPNGFLVKKKLLQRKEVRSSVLVSSGSIAVHPDGSVQLLAEEATLVENLDAKAAQDALADAQRRLGSAKDEKQKAEAQIEVDCAEAAIKAASGAFQ